MAYLHVIDGKISFGVYFNLAKTVQYMTSFFLHLYLASNVKNTRQVQDSTETSTPLSVD